MVQKSKTAKVSLVCGNSRKENIKHALELIKEDLNKLMLAKKILIKPNLTTYSKTFEIANTHIDAVRAILEFIKSHTKDFDKKEIIIAEGCGGAFYRNSSTRAVFMEFGYTELEKEYPNVRLFAIDDEKKFFEVPVTIGEKTEKMKVSNVLKECD